jgi:23S rRNA-/tRNA-specific pseudouridylate synthase
MKRLVLSVPAVLLTTLRDRFDDEAALAEGRVFLRDPGDRGPRRATEADGAETCAPGAEIQVYPARKPGTSGTEDLVVLHAHGGIFAVSKPAGIPTIPDQGGTAGALQSEVARLLKRPLASVHPTSRLDREVSGVVIFALDEQARVALTAAREAGNYRRRYVALGRGTSMQDPRIAGDRFVVDAPIGRDRDPKRRKVHGRDPAAAQSTIEIVARSDAPGKPAFAMNLYPHTGRTHQLRLHAAHSGIPLLGDRTYGGETRLTGADGSVVGLTRIALHAAEVSVPLAEGTLTVHAEVPAFFEETWKSFSTDPVPWETGYRGTV